MSSEDSELSELVGELRTVVEELQTELESARGPPRLPTPRRLAEFTSEVTIPAVILVLETNVRALRLVQRALRLAEGREDTEDTSARARATDLGRATLSRLDDALTDLGSALEGSDTNGEARDLLEEVRDLQSDIEARLEANPTGTEQAASPGGVDIDVDAELQSLKDDIGDGSSHDGNRDNV
jgi:hypothetical protein